MDTTGWVLPVSGDMISPRICHALGALTINWNLCEDVQSNIIQQIARSDWVTAELVLASMPNNTKAALLNDLSEANVKDEDTREAIKTFSRYFSVNLDNRNILVHSLVFPLHFEPGNPAKFARIRKRYGATDQFLDCTPELVEGVVKDVAALFIFGTSIFQKLKNLPPLVRSEPPPKPRKLAEAFQSGKDELRRREPSHP
jgi:hypothetical protein